MRRRAFATLLLAAAAIVASLALARWSRGDQSLPTQVAEKTTFVDVLEVRGELRPVVSRLITAPSSGADLLIVDLAANGSRVNADDVVVQFDSTTQQRTLEQRRSELKQAESEVDKAEAEGRRRVQAADAELVQLESARDRAKLDLQGSELASRVEVEKLQLALSDAEQHVVQLEQKVAGERRAAAADVAIARQKRDKAGYDVAETERTIASLTVKAPSAGQISLMPNLRAGGPMQRSAPEFKRGDRAWFGAPIADLPDLSSVRLGCRVDEADRARLQLDSAVRVRVDAIPDREFDGRITDISLVARPDFTTFPPVRNFDVVVSLADTDPRVKSGMSASARIELDRLEDVVVVPASSVFLRDGATVVYTVSRGAPEPHAVAVARRSKDRVAIASGLTGGERIALRDPTLEAGR
jgi:multidrug efflux pump subunit AcrA (membrane-fusion protein)